MSTTYDASDETHEDYDAGFGTNPTITIPEDAVDLRSASTVNTPLETLSDSLLWTVSRLRGKYYKTDDPWERCPMGAALQNTNSRWEFVFATGVGAWRQCDVTDAGSLVLAVPRTFRSVDISDCVVWVDGDLGAGAHAGAIPGVLPTAKLYISSWGSLSLVGTLTDPSADIAAYEVVHRLTNGSPHVPITATLHDRDQMFIEFTGEATGGGGAAAADLLALLSAYVYVTPQTGALGDEDPP